MDQIKTTTTTHWNEVVHRKRKDLKDSIPNEWVLKRVPTVDSVSDVEGYLNSIMSDVENRIVHTSLLDLRRMIKRGEIKSYDLVKAFCKRAAYVQQMCNCCSEIFFDRALKRASQLDEYYEKNNEVIGPLHGIPISLKDQINLEGIDSAIGYVSKLYSPISKDKVSLLAEILESLGAVFYVKTTTPMAMMSGETNSNIYGITCNSRNRNLSCGGSSGGEGALLGSHGSVLGFGTDIGGSIRLPSSSQGIFGLRCCSNRLPYLNITNSMANQPVMCSVVGPMSVNIDDLQYITKLVLDQKPWVNDPRCLPIPWRDYEPPKKLSFGVFDCNNIGYLHPPVRRAIKMVVTSLKREGHEVIELSPPFTLQQLFTFAGEIFYADGCREILEECKHSGEPCTTISAFDEDGNRCRGVANVNEHWDQYARKYEYQRDFDKFWLETANITATKRPVDGLILPVQPMASFRPGDIKKFKLNFTRAFNVLDYAVVSTPITLADKYTDIKDETYQPLDEDDRVLYDYYDAELYDGTPIGVQVVAPRYEEERAIGLSKLINSYVENHLNPKMKLKI